jgi:hypothetical protein
VVTGRPFADRPGNGGLRFLPDAGINGGANSRLRPVSSPLSAAMASPSLARRSPSPTGPEPSSLGRVNQRMRPSVGVVQHRLALRGLRLQRALRSTGAPDRAALTSFSTRSIL